MLNNEEIVSFPHYLIVNHCNADDFKLGEPLIVNLWLESVKYFILFIIINFQVEIPKICMSKWLLMSNNDHFHSILIYAMVMLIISNGGMNIWQMYDVWTVINFYFNYNVH